jgi:hypothetical protein
MVWRCWWVAWSPSCGLVAILTQAPTAEEREASLENVVSALREGGADGQLPGQLLSQRVRRRFHWRRVDRASLAPPSGVEQRAPSVGG